MIIIHTGGRWDLAARGHAGGPVGQDIVCAAVSTLLDTYAAAARSLDARMRLRQAPGRMEVVITELPRKHRRELEAVRAAVLIGLHRLATAYPARVRLDVPHTGRIGSPTIRESHTPPCQLDTTPTSRNRKESL